MDRFISSLSGCGISILFGCLFTVMPVVILVIVLPSYIIGIAVGLIIGIGILATAYIAYDQQVDKQNMETRADRLLDMEMAERWAALEALSTQIHQVQPNENGAMPVPLGQFLSGGLTGAILANNARSIEANKTYPTGSLSFNYENKPQVDNYQMGQTEDEPTELQPLGPQDISRFGEIIRAGILREGQVFVGFNVMTHEPVFLGGFDHIESLVIAGESTSGKSNSARVILSQMAMMGAKILLSDRHAGHERSLAFGMGALHGCLAKPIAKNEESTIDIVNHAYSEFKLRVAEVDRDYRALHHFDPLVLVIDEFTALMKLPGMFDAIYDRLNTLVIESAKYKIWVQLIGQNWSSVNTGDRADLRQSFQSRMVHKTDQKQSLLFVGTEQSRLTSELPRGQSFFKDATGSTHYVQMPLCTAEDIAIALAGDDQQQWDIEDPQTSAPLSIQLSDVPEIAPDPAEAANGTDNEAANHADNENQPDDVTVRRVLGMIKDGHNIKGITEQIYEADPKTRAGRKASKEILDIIVFSVCSSIKPDTFDKLDSGELMIISKLQNGQNIKEIAESIGGSTLTDSGRAALDTVYATIRKVI